MINQYTFFNNEDEKEEKEEKDSGTMMTKRMEEIYLKQRRVYFWGPVDDKSMEKVIGKNPFLGRTRTGQRD
jgi:ATP-dependent Clp protease, protease subunit